MALSPGVKKRIKSALLEKVRDEMSLADTLGVLQSMSAADKQYILQSFKMNNGSAAGRVMQKNWNDEVRARAGAEADTILADETLTAAELERILA